MREPYRFGVALAVPCVYYTTVCQITYGLAVFFCNSKRKILNSNIMISEFNTNLFFSRKYIIE